MFWKSWHKNDPKKLYALISILLALVILFFLVIVIYGDHWAVVWETFPTLKDKALLLENIHLGIFEIPLEINNYSVQEQYINHGINIPTTPAWIWLGIFVLAWSWLSTQFTYLKRWFYLGSVPLTILMIILLRLDQLIIFGGYSKISVGIALLSTLGLSFLFFSIKKNTAMWLRFLSFLLLNSILLGVFLYGSRLPHPALALTNYGMIIPFFLSIIFIFLVSNQFPHLFLYFIGRSNPIHSRTSIIHFVVIMVIYLANLVLLLLRELIGLKLDILYINAFLILAISAITGVWGLQKNSSLEKHLAFKPIGIGIYLALAFFTFANIGYAIASHNTPLIKVYETAIIYTHFAWGVAFMVYVLLNFHDYNDPTPLYQVTFDDQDDKRMPLYIYRGMGYLIFIGILMYVNIKPLKQAKAAYYNYVADLHIKNEQPKLAEHYYHNALDAFYYNKKSQLSLAQLSFGRGEMEEYITYLEQSNILTPSPEAFIKMGLKLNEVKLGLKTIDILKDGLEIFPKNSPLKNNLAVTYINLGVGDTANVLLSQVNDQELATINALSNWSIQQASDKVLSAMDQRPDIEYQINKYAAYNYRGKSLPNTFQKGLIPKLDTLKPIDWKTASYLYEYTLNQLHTKDSSSIPYIDKYLSHPQSNQSFGLYLVHAKACYYFYNEDADAGLNFLLSQVAREPTIFNNVVGTWLMQMGQYDKAIPYFKDAVLLGMPEASFALGIAYTEVGDYDRAERLWKNIMREDKVPEYMGKKIKQIRRILQASPSQLDTLSDVEKYGLIYYKRYQSNEQAQKIQQSIQSPTYQALAISQLIQASIQANNKEMAQTLFDQSAQLQKVDQWAASKLNLARLKFLLYQKDFSTILANIDKVPLLGYDRYYRYYFKGISLLNMGKVKESLPILQQAHKATPFEEDIYLALHQYYRASGQSKEKSYNILVKGIQYQSESIPLVEAFAFQCLDERIFKYADQSKDRLSEMMSPGEYQAFLQKYNERKSNIENRIRHIIDDTTQE